MEDDYKFIAKCLFFIKLKGQLFLIAVGKHSGSSFENETASEILRLKSNFIP